MTIDRILVRNFCLVLIFFMLVMSRDITVSQCDDIILYCNNTVSSKVIINLTL